MSVGDRSAAATDSGTSTNKDSTRRCDEDEISLITVSRADEENEPLLRPIHTRRFALSSTPRDGTQADSTVPLRTPSLAPVPSASSEDTVSVLEKLAGLLAEKKDRLPQMEPEVFNGDALQYPLWLNAFDTLIERRTDSQSERLFYLGKYTSGEANECISGFLSLFSEDVYDRARRALRARYGDKIQVAEAYRNKISTWPVVKKGDGKNLQKLADFLWQCHAAIDTVKNLASLNSAEEINKLCRILPTYVVEKWARVVDHWYYRYDMDGDDEFPVPDEGEYPPFVEFCKLVSQEARIANGPTNVTRADVKETPPKSAASGGGGFNRRARNFATSSDAATKPPATGGGAGGKPERHVVKPFCYSCKGEHWINNCVDFLRKPSEEKRSFPLYNGLCFGCLRRSHSYKECRSKDPTLLQDADGKAKSATKPPHAAKALQVQTEDDLMNGIFYSMIVPVEVRHPGKPDVYVRTYALLDTQLDSCFLTEKLQEELDAPATGVKLQLVTLGVSECVNSKTVSGLEVMGYNCQREVQLPRCYTRETIPADRRQIPRPEVVKQWPHLQEIAEQLLPYNEDVSIGLLLGYNCPAALMPLSTLHEGSEAPYAVRTALGWSVMGEFAGDTEERNVARSYSTSARALTMLEFTKALDLEFTEHAQSEELVSQDDKLFMKRVEGSLTRAADQRFQMDLPFRSEDPLLPNNRHLALKRLLSLRSKMQRNEVFKQQYCRFMSDLIKSGQAEKAPRTHEDGKLNFLAHHGVQHPRKPGETGVVFDGAAECDGVSLNSALLHGPDLTGNLVGVLSRFRAEKVAFMCDIKGMFLQVDVTPKHRDLLRFLWFEDNDPTKAVVEMRMNVHTFGATSSPTCANYAFQQLPALYESTYSPEVVEFLRRHFYVDDGLKSTATEDQTVETFLRGHELCQHGGFHLCKFTCNRLAVLDRIPEELLAKNAREYQAVGEALPTETSLGLVWQMSSDSFIFLVQMVLGDFTRRSLLSTLSSVYDPLGLLAPVLLVGRLILQKLCLEALAWDAEIPDMYKTQWQAWFADLKQLTELRVPRCVREKTYGAPATVRLHSFSDASQSGYGACVYLQLIDDSGNSDVSLMMAKARIPPKRPVTMPRMELQAAVLAAKVTNFLAKELDYPVMERWYWCDSKVVLGYISNTSKKFHIYVANRAHYIRETTDPTHWNYVKSAENPADLASRGVTSSELIKSSLWWKGPDYLQSPAPITQGPEVPLDDADPEIKREARVFATEKIEPLSMIAMFAKVSDWHRLLRYLAIWRGYLFKLLDRVKNPRGPPIRGEIPPPKIQMQHMKSAKRVVVRLMQQDAFADDYDALQKLRRYPVTRSEARERKNILKRTSNLYRLDVYLGPDELIHVGGRLRRADLPIDLKHPRLLPNRHHITQLIINHYHCAAQHPGRQTNLARLRCAGFWIINGRKAVDSYTKNCVICKCLRGRTMTQKMSDLPVERLDEAAPFTNSTVDF